MVTFDIHGMERKIPEVKAAMRTILAAGFDADYISDKLLIESDIKTPVIVPSCKYMPLETAKRLLQLKRSGVPVYFVDSLPEDVPGLVNLDARRKAFSKVVQKLGAPVPMEDIFARYTPETFKNVCGGNMIRRRNEAGGYNYFFTLPVATAVDGWVKLATEASSAIIFDPMQEKKGKAQLRTAADGCAEIRLQMEPGQSLLIKTFPKEIDSAPWQYIGETGEPMALAEGWTLTFPESAPAISGSFSIGGPVDWTTLDVPEAKVNQGTALYSATVCIDSEKMDKADDWILDLGDVRESAKVFVNGEEVATLVSVPFKVAVGEWLKPGQNSIEVYVTNLASNRIADYDRRGIEWRIFKDANIDTLSDPDFGKWAVDPSGLLSIPQLIPVKY